MTSAPTPAAEPLPVRLPANRVVQGALLIVGAVLLATTAGADRIDFYWTPLILGATYGVAALVDGPRGGYWATALGLTGWGVSVVLLGELRPEQVDSAGAYLAGVGFAGIAAWGLRRQGFLISELGLAATIAASGLILAFTPRAEDSLADATTYAVALGAVGMLNVAGGAVQVARARREPA